MANQTYSAFRLARSLAGLGFAAAVALAHGASAQTMTTNSASFNAGFGRTSGDENRPVDVQMTDANGNLTVVNGIIRANAAGSVFAGVGGAVSAGFSGVAGAQDSFSGTASGASASAIGNNLNVVVQGDNNTVIVTATQTNTGAVTATTTTSGK